MTKFPTLDQVRAEDPARLEAARISARLDREEAARLRAQRDELLAALEDAVTQAAEWGNDVPQAWLDAIASCKESPDD